MEGGVPAGWDKEAFVRDMFSSIAHRYDLLNTILTLGRDGAWRRFAVAQTGLGPGGRGLDVCCGTGRLAFEQARVVGREGSVVGVDFCDRMLEVAKRNLKKTPFEGIVRLIKADALDLPFPPDTFDCATMGFGLRNVADIRRALAEMRRVVRPGGTVVTLDLATPRRPGFREVYRLYLRRLVPLIGRLGVGLPGPYRYLSQSLETFPGQEALRGLFAEAGLVGARCIGLAGGVVAVHVGRKA
ncbi:MAG: bifunctional demethylmenaquinone methyltransferase/2-methoxy-6-polyprenyl-1,4-benzoquinol methylase UbiE [Acetobacteraceae bacterium]|nr:bifunctional demethylmenaquinone methyltransferase/2-methoxy-6-polyprenyl-1,4-benzoquinol methylase UbiE [Acetobacteraceae bacterium]